MFLTSQREVVLGLSGFVFVKWWCCVGLCFFVQLGNLKSAWKKLVFLTHQFGYYDVLSVSLR